MYKQKFSFSVFHAKRVCLIKNKTSKKQHSGTGNPSPTGRKQLLRYVGDGFPVP